MGHLRRQGYIRWEAGAMGSGRCPPNERLSNRPTKSPRSLDERGLHEEPSPHTMVHREGISGKTASQHPPIFLVWQDSINPGPKPDGMLGTTVWHQEQLNTCGTYCVSGLAKKCGEVYIFQIVHVIRKVMGNLTGSI